MTFESGYIINTSTGCWNWFRAITTAGYGEIFYLGKMRYAHRVSIHIHRGFDLDSPLCILHKCDNRSCVNPNHLFEGTIADNNLDMQDKGRARGRFSGRSHCVHGHPLSGNNLYIKPDGKRACRQCKTDRDKVYRPWRYSS